MLAIISFIVAIIGGIFSIVMLIVDERLSPLWGCLVIITFGYGVCGITASLAKPTVRDDISRYNKAKAEAEILKSDLKLSYSTVTDYISDIEAVNKRICTTRKWKNNPYMCVFYNDEVAEFKTINCDTITVCVVPDKVYLKN